MATTTTTATLPPPLTSRTCHFAPPPPVGKFAFARLKSDPRKGVHLVRLVNADSETPTTHPELITLHLFRHEFISIFRHAGSTTVHPSELRILQVVDDASTRYEEEHGVVFLERRVALEGMRR
ncbi:hypothetical protein BDZ89DRAFT_1077194 [Hymenopellis radicata]|nr:hypothetical protein BDZ89DRAFT_1077194 [Hymenopellis radicata]